MSVYIPLVRAVVSELCNPGVLMMQGDPVGGGGAGTRRGHISISDICNPTDTGRGSASDAGASNPTGADPGTGGANNQPAAGDANTTGLGGTLKAGNKNGVVVIDDPNHQGLKYKPGETNQPYAGNVAKVLDHQRVLGTQFSRYFFDEDQERFFFDLLRHESPKIHDRFFLAKDLTRTVDSN